MKVLIVYASKYGQTQKIANFIGQRLMSRGYSVGIFDVQTMPSTVTPLNFDMTIVGAPVYKHEFSKELTNWCKYHSQSLNLRSSSFFSVCLGVMQNSNEVKSDEVSIVVDFFHQCDWYPKIWTIFGGALTYSKYNWFLKFLMKRISSKAGVETKTTQDYEYTDWDKVRDFTKENLKQIENRVEDAF